MTNARRGTLFSLLARMTAGIVIGSALAGSALIAAGPASAAAPIPISGTGSTWAQNALDLWRRDLAGDVGMTVNYSGVGSTAARRDFINQTVDFAVSELPFQADGVGGSGPEIPTTAYTYTPLVAGGTALMYNLRDADGARMTNLRLSDATVAGIFTGSIRSWNDPAIAAENPDIALPSKEITPVVRADHSGSSYEFTSWLKNRQPDRWNSMCDGGGEPGAADCPATPQFPTRSFMRAQNGSLGVAGYVSQGYGEGAITYVENSYAQNSGLSAAKILNSAGYYVAPTSAAVSIALLGASVSAPSSPEHGTLRLDGVYTNPDPRAYPLSSVAYLIAPAETTHVFTEAKGATLGDFGRYAACAGQNGMPGLGYAPLPLNLAQAALAGLARVPGAEPGTVDGCVNPTFVAGDTVRDSLLTRTAPMPPESDRAAGAPSGSCVPAIGSADVMLCATTIAAVDSPLSLELPAGAAADFEEPRLVNGRSLTVGALPEITVRDGRAVTHPGWDLVATVADFRNTADDSIVISSVDAGLRPAVLGGNGTSGGSGGGPGVVAGPGEIAGAAAYPTVFASAETGTGVGDTLLGGEVSLLSPPDRPAGTYRSGLTLTLVSR